MRVEFCGKTPISGGKCRHDGDNFDDHYCCKDEGHTGSCFCSCGFEWWPKVVVSKCSDTVPDKDCPCGGERGKASCMFPDIDYSVSQTS